MIFAFFCLINAQFVMIMSMFFTTEACLFQVVTICMQFSELGKQGTSQNSVYLTREACSKNIICNVCKVSKRCWRTWIVFPLYYWLTKFVNIKGNNPLASFMC